MRHTHSGSLTVRGGLLEELDIWAGAKKGQQEGEWEPGEQEGEAQRWT